MRKYFPSLFALLLPFLDFAQSTLLIKNVSIVDIKTNKINKNKTVIVTGNRITSITSKKVGIKDVIVINGAGKYLMPGLWDMHAHTLTDKRYVYCFPLLIANGVTGVREMADNLPIEQVNVIRRDVEDGKILGPRVGALSYRLLDGPGTQFSNVAVEVTTAEQARQLVRMYKNSGADFIKPYNLLSREVYSAIADEARKQNIPVEGHVPFSMTPAEVSDLGQRSIEHNFGVLLSCSQNEMELQKKTLAEPNLWGRFEAQAASAYDEQKAHELYRKFVDNDTWTCPTIVTYRPLRFGSDSVLLQDTLLEYIPKSVLKAWHETFMQRISNVPDSLARKARDKMRMYIVGDMYHSGVNLLAGTDMPVPYVVPGFSLHDELELLVRSGLTIIDALRTATLNPAKFLGKENDFGTVEEGKIADLILLDANPLENISNTRKIDAVILNGKILARNDLDDLLQYVKEIAGGDKMKQ